MKPPPPCGASQSQLRERSAPANQRTPGSRRTKSLRMGGRAGGAAMSDWDASSDEELGTPGWPPAALAAGPLCWSPSTSSWSRASVEGGGQRGKGRGSPGGEGWTPRGAEGSGGARRAARPVRARDSAGPLCFHLDSALVGALIGNDRVPDPLG